MRYKLNREAYARLVPRGNRMRVLELSGISREIVSRIYRSAFLDSVRREMLAKNVGVSHDELWIRI